MQPRLTYDTSVKHLYRKGLEAALPRSFQTQPYEHYVSIRHSVLRFLAPNPTHQPPPLAHRTR